MSCKLATLIPARKHSNFFANQGLSSPPLAADSYRGLYSKVLQSAHSGLADLTYDSNPKKYANSKANSNAKWYQSHCGINARGQNRLTLTVRSAHGCDSVQIPAQ